MKYRLHCKLTSGDEAFVELKAPKPHTILAYGFHIDKEITKWVSDDENAYWPPLLPAEIIQKDMTTRNGLVVNTAIEVVYSWKEVK